MPGRYTPERLAVELHQADPNIWSRRRLKRRAYTLQRSLLSKPASPTERSLNALLAEAATIDEPNDRIGELSLELNKYRERAMARGAFVVVLTNPKLEVRREDSSHALVTEHREWSLMEGRPYFAYSDFDELQVRFGSFSLLPRGKEAPGALRHETTILPREHAGISAHVVDVETARDIALICGA